MSQMICFRGKYRKVKLRNGKVRRRDVERLLKVKVLGFSMYDEDGIMCIIPSWRDSGHVEYTPNDTVWDTIAKRREYTCFQRTKKRWNLEEDSFESASPGDYSS